MQLKTIESAAGETIKVTNEWAAQAEARNTTVAGSTWSGTGSLTLGTPALSGTTASTTLTVSGCGCITNTVTFANGETLVGWRYVAV